jgi:hypothetical protein
VVSTSVELLAELRTVCPQPTVDSAKRSHQWATQGVKRVASPDTTGRLEHPWGARPGGAPSRAHCPGPEPISQGGSTLFIAVHPAQIQDSARVHIHGSLATGRKPPLLLYGRRRNCRAQMSPLLRSRLRPFGAATGSHGRKGCFQNHFAMSTQRVFREVDASIAFCPLTGAAGGGSRAAPSGANGSVRVRITYS